MHTVELKIDNSIYDNVMFFLKNLQPRGLEIREKNSETEGDTTIDFSNYKIETFKDIKDPVKWQQEIRKEWE